MVATISLTPAAVLLLLLLVPSNSGEDPGRDPCKTSDNGFGLVCSNITSQFFTSAMFFSLDDDMARFTGEMKRLEIQRSNITRLQPASFKQMPHLSYLIARNISLRDIARGAFEGLSELKMADLSLNRLSEMPVDAFRDTRLSHLDLGGNPDIRIPTNGPVLDAKRLRSLILSRCNVQHLPGSAFVRVLALTHLDLSGNQLEMLPRDVFSPLEHLDFLDLSGNRFRTLPFAVFTSLPSYPNLPTSVILAGNPWSCDCRISGLIRWATRNGESNAWSSIPSISRLRKRTVCREPDDLDGVSWNDDQLRRFVSTC